MLYLCGIHFALRSGEEHRSLQMSQFELIVSKDGGAAHLVYTENYSKNNQGLQHRKVRPKCVTYYANEGNPDRCLVRLYQLYISHRPADVPHFYLTPLRKKIDHVWYSRCPLDTIRCRKQLGDCVNWPELLASRPIILFESPVPHVCFRVG